MPAARRVEPAWAEPNRERKRKHVTLQFLLAEYIDADPDGYCYSRFCDFCRGWVSRLSVTMRQAHLGGMSCSSTMPASGLVIMVQPVVRPGGRTCSGR